MKKFSLTILISFIYLIPVKAAIDSDLYQNIKTGCLYTAQMKGDNSIETKKFCTCMANVYDSHNNNSTIEILLTNASKNNLFMREYVIPKCA